MVALIEEAIFRLGLVVGMALPLLHVFPLRLLTRCRITRERHAEIRAGLDARKAAAAAESTAASSTTAAAATPGHAR